ncbi:MAG: methyltransferase [Bacteroidetes bacterium]|nr:methyltransferase [Bacteroidota bacterium]
MPNSYFRFKQFTIHQDQCAMKVCTDSCILGAWFAAKIPSYSYVLDIGSGTGLLMLMLAQKNKAEINGIEIDLTAVKQLKQNIAASKWKERLKVFPGDVRSWSFSEKYDFIISNPPFYEGDLHSEYEQKNIAKHSTVLGFEDLLSAIDTSLKPSGSFGVLLPYHRAEAFEEMALKKNFFLMEKLLIKQTPAHDYFRAVLHFSRSNEDKFSSFELTIQNEKGNYTGEFVELMKDYYLYL